MDPSTEAFFEHVAGHAGVSLDRAEQVTRAVLARIGASLTPGRRQQIAEELPPAIASSLLEHDAPVHDAFSVHHREIVASVYHVLAEDLSNDALGWLRTELPERMAEMLVADASSVTHTSTLGDTLATGRPGSKHPLSESGKRR
jgi:uncharacterized protein (DUF2267 family)